VNRIAGARLAVFSAALLCTSLPALAAKQPMITLYTDDNFRGPSLQLVVPATDLHAQGFAKRTTSFIVRTGTWQLCDRANFAGKCVTVGPGKYPASFDNGFSSTVVSLRIAPQAP
jgi:hypothetical protein